MSVAGCLLAKVRLDKVLADGVELLLGGRGELALGGNVGENVTVVGLDVGEELLLKVGDLGGVNLIEEAANTAEEDNNLVLKGHGDVLALLEELGEADTTVEEALCGGIEVRAKLGKGSNLTVLSKLELHLAGNLLHGLGLGSGTDAGHGETDVDGGADTLVEELSLEEDLTVSDGDHVGGDVRGHVTSLGLNDGEGGQGARARLVGHLGGTLEQTRVEVEHITGVGLTTRGTAEEQGHLAVGNGLLGKIVKDDQGVLLVVTEVLAHGGTGVWGEVLQGRGIGGGGGDDDRVLEGVVGAQALNELGNGGALLADGDVDAVQLLGVVRAVVEALLVDDGVNGDGGLTRLTVTNDQLTLATADGHERVDGLDAGLHGLAHRLAGDDAWGLDTDTGAGHVLGKGALSTASISRILEAFEKGEGRKGEKSSAAGTREEEGKKR